MIHFEAKYVDPKSSLMYSGVSVPQNIVKQIQKLDNKRFIITINESISFPGTIIPVEKGLYIILINKQRAKKLKLSLGELIQVNMVQDNSKYGMPIPEEMEMVLDEDPEGKAFLEALTPGKIRSLIYLVEKVKNPDKRIEKSIVILEHLRANNGILDYKMLNVAFKEYNQR